MEGAPPPLRGHRRPRRAPRPPRRLHLVLPGRRQRRRPWRPPRRRRPARPRCLRSMATRPMAPARSWSSWLLGGSPRSARSSRPSPRPAASARTLSASTSGLIGHLPAGVTVKIRRDSAGDGIAHFASACSTCPLRPSCTEATGGRSICVGRYENLLADARAEQHSPEWAEQYRSTRPKVERKFGHMMRRKHGGRRARVRGRLKVAADFDLLAAAQNLARLATLGISSAGGEWVVAGA